MKKRKSFGLDANIRKLNKRIIKGQYPECAPRPGGGCCNHDGTVPNG
jgi:hypothetical protein